MFMFTLLFWDIFNGRGKGSEGILGEVLFNSMVFVYIEEFNVSYVKRVEWCMKIINNEVPAVRFPCYLEGGDGDT